MRLIPVLTLALAAMVGLLMTGCAGTSATARTSSTTRTAAKTETLDPNKLTEREKWAMARSSYSQALKEQSRKNNESAAYYYEVALELLGTLDMASIEIPTQRVLSFQRKVLKSYDAYLASVDKLPSTTGPEAVLEASVPGSPSEDSELFEGTEDDRDLTPIQITPNAPPLPPVPVAMNNQVSGQINFFMNKGRKVMLAWMDRATRIFPRLRPILREEGIPDEVMYLAMIESGLNPRAYSYAHAAGVWQFIPSTGRLYGLEINSVFDERMHVESSTRAACRYLRKLYEEFDDWYLAFAAYNCGELRVEREIKRSKTRDYFRLHKLPRQTRGYVPIYLAARTICENPERYGFPEVAAEVPFECERTYVDGAYKLEHIAQAAGHDPEIVKDLNPEFVRGVTRSGHTNMVRLPREAADDFSRRLAAMPETVVKPTKIHIVKKGETLGRIAQRYGTSVRAIQSQPENRGLKANRLRIGQRITIPVPDVVSVASEKNAKTVEPVASRETKPQPNADHEIIYTVHRGETLSKISQQLGVSLDEICRQNGIKNPDLVQPGRRLKIKVSGGEVAQTGTNGTKVHTVQPGDTVWSIAQAYGQDYQNILRWNRLNKRSKIFPGQEIIVSQ
ncbi:MAG: LysM peptidoglycan-binding domain-containing protein [Calditrichota bacterium]